jgi:NAD(P)-dependent dehydrogenase (short-subunit alcohol dehydrogenase family)
MKVAQLFEVSGLATVITGAASGIGFACAEAMSDNGAQVTLMDVNEKTLADAVAALEARGGKVRGQVLDVTDRPALRRAFDEASKHYGRLDVVFANAGISGGPGFLTADRERNPERALETFADEMIDRLIDTNYKSTFATIQAAARHMKPRRSGRIIVTSTISTFNAELYVGAPYVVSKAGLMQMMRQAALELAGYNIQVNAMAPGPFATNIGGGRLRDPAARALFDKQNPTGRIGEPDDIQGLALFLASPASSYITGAQIVIDGGLTLSNVD